MSGAWLAGWTIAQTRNADCRGAHTWRWGSTREAARSVSASVAWYTSWAMMSQACGTGTPSDSHRVDIARAGRQAKASR